MSRAFSAQNPGTTPFGQNVRSFDPSTNRARGGSRPCLSRYINAIPGGSAALIQELACIVGVGYTDPGGSAQTNSSGRVVNLVAVVGGKVYVASAGGTAWVTANGQSSAQLATTGVIRSTSNNQLLWFVDGVNAFYYDPSINSMQAWTPTAGSLPIQGSNRPRLIDTWRGRIIQSGISSDPQNWFMSRVDDPFDWDYFPQDQDPGQPVAGNNSTAGKVGAPITSLMPYTDDVMVFGTESGIWQLNGDPMAGGQLDQITNDIGTAWGAPWCTGPNGTLYFVSNRMGIYAMVPGQNAPQRISQQIEELIQPVDSGLYTIRLQWDDRFQALHVFVTKTSAAAETTHLLWEQRAGAWWIDEFANNNHNPLCCCVFDGNELTDRVSLIGSWDGYVRSFDPTATKDDGYAVESEVWIGPLTTQNFDDLLCKDLQAVLGEDSGSVTFAVHVGRTAEAAYASTAVATGTWSASRNYLSLVRRSGHAIFVRITATVPWALEGIRARLGGTGKVRRRGV